MGNLSELDLLHSYHKGVNDIAQEFYLPCMSNASIYNRAVGFFNSSIYIIAWPGLKDFVRSGGKINIICSPVLTPQDISSISTGYSSRLEKENAENMRIEIQKMLDDPYIRKPTQVLAALVAVGVIDIQIAFMGNQAEPRHRRLFHDKMGIFIDEFENVLVFKGSMNETWAGLSADGNLDSIDVFLGWGGERDEERVRDEIAYFNRLWENNYPNVVVRKFPEIARKELIERSDVKKWPELVDEIVTDIEVTKSFSADARRDGRTPRPHQINALNEWLARDRRGILEHATGSGKTFTALCAIRDSLIRKETVLVLVPTEILFRQWYDEIKETFIDLRPPILLCGAGNNQWRKSQLLTSWTQKSNNPRIVLSMMQTSATDDFLKMVRQGPHLFLVVDEVHRIGSNKHRKILKLKTGPRLGLSATPRRAGDLVGTELIMDYFNGIIPPPFTLKDAIDSRTLTPYMYFFHTCSLMEDEQIKWDRITKKIQQLYAQNKSEAIANPLTEELIKNKLIERSRIIKSAKNKIKIASSVVSEKFEKGQKWIIYCDSVKQLKIVLSELQKRGFNAKEYHSDMEGDREQTLKYFERNGGLLVSIRCLDEGVDIPSATHGLILASSKNPREFIQRRGRLLRRSSDKYLAFLHDAIVLPGQQQDDSPPGTSILEGEIARAIEFGENAQNPSSIYELKRLAVHFGIDYSKFNNEGFEDND